MNEVYFCMVLHKDEDRRHFLFCVLVLQTPDNQHSLLYATKVKPEVSLKNAHNTLLHNLFSLPTFQHVSTL